MMDMKNTEFCTKMHVMDMYASLYMCCGLATPGHVRACALAQKKEVTWVNLIIRRS